MKRTSTQHRQGFALVLVIVAIAIVSMLGFAILSAASLQLSESESALQSAQADELAESGIVVAMYYLQHPSNAPSLSGGVWPGATNMTINRSVGGTVSVTVSGSGSQYQVRSIGNRTGGTMGSQSRSLAAVVNVSRTFAVNQALASNCNLTIPAGFVVTSVTTGAPAISTTGTLTVQPLAFVTGALSASSVTSQSLPATTQPAPSSSIVPTTAQVNHYSTYTYNGSTYTAGTISASTLNSQTLGPTASNPAGVYVASKNLAINAVTINGTLVVQGATLVVAGGSSTVTPVSGFPAMIVDNSLEMSGVGTGLTANGVVWLGQGMSSDPNTLTMASLFTVNGALLMNSAGFVTPVGGTLPPYTVQVTYNAQTASAAGLTSAVGTPQQIQVVSWTPG